MEGFCLDIQRIILGDVANGRVSRLYRLARVNRMFRNWVARFAMDTVNKNAFHGTLSQYFGNYDPLLARQWDILSQVGKEWEKKPHLLGALIMMVDVIQCPTHQPAMPKPLWGTWPIFTEESRVLRDFKKRCSYRLAIEHQNIQIQDREGHIQKAKKTVDYHTRLKKNNEKKRDAAQDGVSILDQKYKKTKN